MEEEYNKLQYFYDIVSDRIPEIVNVMFRSHNGVAVIYIQSDIRSATTIAELFIDKVMKQYGFIQNVDYVFERKMQIVTYQGNLN